MLPKKNRIPRKDFPSHKMKGLRVFSPFFSAVFYQAGKKETRDSRASVVVSKKTAKTAIDRNTLRRRFYNLLGLYFKESSAPITIVIYPKADAKNAPLASLRVEIEKAFKKARIVK